MQVSRRGQTDGRPSRMSLKAWVRTTRSTSRPSTGTRPSLRHRGHQYAADALVAPRPCRGRTVRLRRACRVVRRRPLFEPRAAPELHRRRVAGPGAGPPGRRLLPSPTAPTSFLSHVWGIALHKGGRQPRPRNRAPADVPSWNLSDLAREKFRTLRGRHARLHLGRGFHSPYCMRELLRAWSCVDADVHVARARSEEQRDSRAAYARRRPPGAG